MQATHPLLAAAAVIDAELKAIADCEPAFLPTASKAQALLEFTQLGARLDALRLRVMAVADDVADEEAARDVGAWLGARTHCDRRGARRDLNLALAEDQRWHQLAAAHVRGRVNTDQAQVIARALDALPTEVGGEVLAKAEAHLVDQAADFGPDELRVLGHRVLEVVAPDVVDEHDRRALEREEQAALRRTSLTTRGHGDGTTTIKARVPEASATRLLTYLEAYTAPRQSLGTVTADRRPYSEQLGHAFCAFLEHADPDRMPLHGGTATSVVVMLGLDSLVTGLGTATTNTGETLSAEQARRLACTAGLIPAVLGTKGEVLDLGRSARLYNKPQRKAMALRDQTCRAEGCDIPAAWTEAHHLKHWSEGGSTDLDAGLLLCSHHHHRAHDVRYEAKLTAGRRMQFHRRT